MGLGTIWDNIKRSPNERPKYTSYELRHMVKKKREETGLSMVQFADKHNVSLNVLNDLELSSRCFNVPMYQACEVILGMTREEILAKEVDNVSHFQNLPPETQATFDLANELFNEMVMQEKISVN